jgi:hypothetical protein
VIPALAEIVVGGARARPFADHLPPPIVPVEITIEDLEAIMAYVSGVAPADLGAPIQHQ